MATFEIEAGDAKYQVEAPDMETALSALGMKPPGETGPLAGPNRDAVEPAAGQVPTAQQPSIGADILKSAGSGLVRGVTGLAGLPGDIEHLMSAGWDAIAPEALKVGNAPKIGGLKPATTADIEGSMGLEGALHEPETQAGKYARTIAEFVPASVAGPGGVVRKALTQAVVPGIASEAAGQATEGTSLEAPARIAAAVASPFATSAAGRLITPIPARPQAARAAETLAAEGVPTTAGQATGSRILRYAESHLGDMPGAGGAARNAEEAQAEAFTRAALRRVGEDAPRATPEVIDRAFARIGGEFDRLSAGAGFTIDHGLQHDLRQAVADYNHAKAPHFRSPIIEELANDVLNNPGRTVSGASYQDTRSTLARLERNTADGELRIALGNIREALDAAMTRAVPPADAQAWMEARRQYRNMLAIERAATAGGAGAAGGLISPQQLRTALVGQSRRAYARGQGDFNDMVHAGAEIMHPLPQSGTGPRTALTGITTAVGSALGLGGGPAGAIGGAVAGAVAPGIAGRAILSRPAQAYLGNQVIAEPLRALEPGAAAVVNTASALPEASEGRRLESNQTYQYLVKSGMAPGDAAAVMSDPRKLQEALKRIAKQGAR